MKFRQIHKKLFFSFLFILIFSVSRVFGESNFSAERLRQACKSYVESVTGNDVDITIATNIIDQSFDNDNIIAKFKSNGSVLKGNTHIAIEFYNGQELIKRLEIPVRIKVFRNMPVSARAIRKGEEISDADIRIIRSDVTYLRDDDLVDDDYMSGKKASRNIPEGVILLNNYFAPDISISRGDKVTIIVESGSVRIRSTGVSLQDGSIGGFIRIKRDGSKKIIEGKIGPDAMVYLKIN